MFGVPGLVTTEILSLLINCIAEYNFNKPSKFEILAFIVAKSVWV